MWAFGHCPLLVRLGDVEIAWSDHSWLAWWPLRWGGVGMDASRVVWGCLGCESPHGSIEESVVSGWS